MGIFKKKEKVKKEEQKVEGDSLEPSEVLLIRSEGTAMGSEGPPYAAYLVNTSAIAHAGFGRTRAEAVVNVLDGLKPEQVRKLESYKFKCEEET